MTQFTSSIKRYWGNTLPNINVIVCWTYSAFFLLRPHWKPSYCTYCNSILSLLCFLHSGFIFLGTKAINIWITYSIFIVYLSVSRRDQLLSESEPHLVFVIILILLILSPEAPCFSLQECEIMNMVRAERFQKFQNDMLTLEPMKESIEKPCRELYAFSCFVDTMKSMSMFVKCTAIQGWPDLDIWLERNQ